MAHVHAINSDKAIKAIKQAIACHGFCGSEVPWKITLTGWPTCRGKGLLLKAKAKDSEFVLEDTSRPRTKAKDNNTAHCFCTRSAENPSYASASIDSMGHNLYALSRRIAGYYSDFS